MEKMPRSNKELQAASEHLLYEIQMLYMLCEYLAEGALDKALADRGDGGLPARNAAIESFGVHLRNLLAFFYNQRSRRGGDSDLTANEFVTDRRYYKRLRGPRDTHVLGQDAVERIHKQIAHLSHARHSFRPDDRTWLYRDICQALAPIVSAFLTCVDRQKVAQDFIAQARAALELQQGDPTRVVLPADYGLNISNGGTATVGMRMTLTDDLAPDADASPDASTKPPRP